MFEPRAHNQRYCSLRCKRWVSNHSARHLAAKARHDARRRESGLKAMQDARWYANGGWEKQDRAQRRRRLAEKIERLEQLTGQDRPDLTEALDGAGLVWTLKRPESAHSDETRDALGRLWV